jgi:hypothetical protein
MELIEEIRQELAIIARKHGVHVLGNIKKDGSTLSFDAGEIIETTKKDCSNCKTPWEENHACLDALQINATSETKLSETLETK